MKHTKQVIFFGVIALLLVQIPVLKAGKIELTTYYPAPDGDYKSINTTEDTRLATASGNVGIGTTTPDSGAKLEVNNTLRLTPVTGGATKQAGGAEGAIRYSKDASGSGVGGLLYKNASSWMPLAGGQGVQGTVVRYDASGQKITYDYGSDKGYNLGKHVFCAIARMTNAEDGHHCAVFQVSDKWYVKSYKTGCQVTCLD